MRPEVVELNSEPEDDDLIVMEQPARHQLAEEGLVITGERPARQPLREHSEGLHVHLPDRVIEIPGRAPPRERATNQLINENRDRLLAQQAEARSRQARQQAVVQRERSNEAVPVPRPGFADMFQERRELPTHLWYAREDDSYDYDYNDYEDDDYHTGDELEDIDWNYGARQMVDGNYMLEDGTYTRFHAVMPAYSHAIAHSRALHPWNLAGLAFTAGGRGRGTVGDNIPEEVFRQIEESENAIMDQRRHDNLAGTRTLRQNMRKELKNLPKGFTSSIVENEEYACVLCGVILGVGIPDDFKPVAQTKPFSAMRELYDCNAPYQAVNYLTTADRDLSKRIFACSCGHVYCGRCVNAITNIKQRLQGAKSKGMKKTTMDINNPYIFAPLKCVASGCNEGTRGQKKFVEIFL